jgi:hypothetical protein
MYARKEGVVISTDVGGSGFGGRVNFSFAGKK